MQKDEFWQEYDARGVRILNGGLPVHSDTDEFYAGVAIMLYRFRNGEVEFLFQKRSKFVDRNAEKWDASASGHMNYEELVLDAVVREAREEIGAEIDIKKVEFAAKYRAISNMMVYLYFYDYSEYEDNFHFDDKEVEEVKWVPYKDYEDFSIGAPVKEILREDTVFNLYLDRWQKKIREKYGNL